MDSHNNPSIVIIGAGSAGMSAALRAGELGATNVTVLERKYPASGSSGLSAGVFNINGTDPLTIEIRIRTRAMLDSFERENGMHLSRIGHLRLGRNERHAKLFEDVIGWQTELGVAESSTLLAPEQILGLVPDLNVEDVVTALWNPRDGHMDGPLLCGVLSDRAQALGVKVLPKHPVTGYRKERGQHVLTTPEGDFKADVVINAAGPWAQQIGEMLGAPLPLVSQVHDVIKVSVPEHITYTVPMVQEYIPGDEVAIYFRQDAPHSLICGEHTYAIEERFESVDPDDYRKTIPWETWEGVAQRVAARLPIEDLGFEPGWTGLYPISADGQSVFGPYEHDASVIAAGGMGGHGLTTGVCLGRVAAEWAILGQPRSISGGEQLLPDRPSLREAVGTRA